MAIADIPPFVPSAPDDLIRSEDINNVQRLTRDTVRSHRHTRSADAPVDDASPLDLALQITTSELVDLSVTSAALGAAAIGATHLDDAAVGSGVLADGAATATKLQDGAVTAAKVAANAVARAKLQDNAVSRAKLALVEIGSGSQSLGGSGTIGVPNQAFITLFTNLADTLNTVFLTSLTLTGASGPATQSAQVESAIAYRRAQGFSSGPPTVDLLLHLTNTGVSNCTVSWRVMTFGPFNPPSYPFGFRAGIGGELI
jgi:hypothetical protein